jgi:hypothetical protein
LAYLLMRRLATRRAAILAAVFYTVNPNTLLMSYVRSDFAEQLACAIFPLLLLAALTLCGFLENSQPLTRRIAKVALLYGAVWLCNAPAGVIASYTLALLIAWAAVTCRSLRVFLHGGAALAVGLGLASFYLIPAAYEQRWVNIGQALSSGLAPWQNFLFTAIDDVEHTWFNWIASICALALILVFASAALLSRKFAAQEGARNQQQPAFVAILIGGTAATALTMRWTLPLWNHLPELRFVQFPWRWMSIIALAAACFLAALAEKRRGWIAVILTSALIVPLASFLVRNTWWDQDEMPTLANAIPSGIGFDGTDEYDPLGDDHLDLPVNAAQAKVLPVDSPNDETPHAKVQVQEWTTNEKQIRVNSPEPARIALRVLNYPAWKIEVNGKPLPPERMNDVNQMVIPVSAGISEIRVRFTRTTDRTIGDLMALLSGLTTLVFLWPRRRLRS